MRVRLSPTARERFSFIDAWWRANRDRAPDLFARELTRVIELLPTLCKTDSFSNLLDTTHVVSWSSRGCAAWRGHGPRIEPLQGCSRWPRERATLD
jgi:hypothetical protein